MRRAASIAVAGLLALAACDQGADPVPAAPVVAPKRGPKPAAFATIEEERTANERAFRDEYIPRKSGLMRDDSTRWVVIVGGHLIHPDAKMTTIAEADAAARAAAPQAWHRFVFQPGEEGDREEFIGGTDKPHIFGNTFMAAWQGVAAMGESVTLLSKAGGTTVSGRWRDGRPFAPAEVAPPIGGPVSRPEEFCLATGYPGSAAMPYVTAAAARLEMWEIPGVARLSGVMQKGDCRRARAKFRVPGAEPEITVQVAIWPSEPR